jgi:hypothetical protein
MDIVSPSLIAACLYAGLLIIMSVVLQARVIMRRRATRIGIGDGNDRDLARAIRVHGNFVEAAPFALAALILLALIDTRPLLMHLFGLAVLGGRIAHAIGLSQSAGVSLGRMVGMILTTTALMLAALALIVLPWL